MKVGSVWDHERLYLMALMKIELAGYGPVPLAAIIDTGFTEWLALPPNMIGRLGLRAKGRETLKFANSTIGEVDLYEARVNWCGNWLTIDVHEIEDHPTIGMELLRGYRVVFDALGEGVVDVEPVVGVAS